MATLGAMPSPDSSAPRPPAASAAPDGQDAPILIVTAMPEEAAPLRARLGEATEIAAPFVTRERGVSAMSGTLAGRAVTVLTCGVGSVAAASAATWAILALAPRAVISAGSAGGLAADIEVGALVVGTEFRGSIADATAFGYAPGQVPGQPESFAADAALAAAAQQAARAVAQTETAEAPQVRSGLMIAGDAFVTAPLAESMRERFPGALSADMETTALAQTCAGLGVPYVALRAISDLCGPRADQQFHLELDLVAEASAAAVTQLVEHL